MTHRAYFTEHILCVQGDATLDIPGADEKNVHMGLHGVREREVDRSPQSTGFARRDSGLLRKDTRQTERCQEHSVGNPGWRESKSSIAHLDRERSFVVNLRSRTDRHCPSLQLFNRSRVGAADNPEVQSDAAAERCCYL
jgi:hypothetical protein